MRAFAKLRKRAAALAKIQTRVVLEDDGRAPGTWDARLADAVGPRAAPQPSRRPPPWTPVSYEGRPSTPLPSRGPRRPPNPPRGPWRRASGLEPWQGTLGIPLPRPERVAAARGRPSRRPGGAQGFPEPSAEDLPMHWRSFLPRPLPRLVQFLVRT